jgi:DNA polymerase-3 subunit epsilon
MLDWLININKDFPEFWKKYLSKFEKKSKRFVVLSMETTGLNPEIDVILSIGAFAVLNNSIYIGDSFEAVFAQYKFFHDNGISNEFTLESKMEKLGEAEEIQ